MKVPESIASAYSILSPYVLDASQLSIQTSLSLAILPQLLVPNDGDGIVQLRSPHKLDHAIHHRLFAVDAPELYATSFVHANGVTIKRRNGHLAHLAVHYYMDNFLGTGTASIRTEIPRNGAQQPMDNYQRRISSFWFVWTESPNASELAILDEVSDVLTQLRHREARARVMSMSDPRNATAASPFLLNLNALLVLAGFCHVYTR